MSSLCNAEPVVHTFCCPRWLWALVLGPAKFTAEQGAWRVARAEEIPKLLSINMRVVPVTK